MVSWTLFRATKSSAHTSLDNVYSMIESFSSILQIQLSLSLAGKYGNLNTFCEYQLGEWVTEGNLFQILNKNI